MRLAAASAREHGVPWVLDPVAVGALAHRTALAVELLGARPAVIRGNGSEIQALAAAAGVTPGTNSGGRGVDSLASSDDAVEAASALATDRSCVVAVSGATDYVTDGTTTLSIGGGDPMMTRVTGMGCALGALIAAAVAVERDPLAAAGGSSAVFAAAGEQAAAGAAGPGSFAVAFLDRLATLADGAIGPGAGP